MLKHKKNIGYDIWSDTTFNDESENPPATKDPSWDIDEQFKLGQFIKKISI
jgi:hypothetical protein